MFRAQQRAWNVCCESAQPLAQSEYLRQKDEDARTLAFCNRLALKGTDMLVEWNVRIASRLDVSILDSSHGQLGIHRQLPIADQNSPDGSSVIPLCSVHSYFA